MSSTDQIVREMSGMAFAELEYNKLRKGGASHEEALDGATEAAIRNVNETIGNYTDLNKPDVFRGSWFNRALGYLRTYSRERTAYHFRMLRDIMHDSPYQTKTQAAAELMATTLLGAMAGGVAATFGYSVACAILNQLRPTLYTDEENAARRKADPLAADDVDYWLRNRYIPYHFGSDSMVARMAKHGLLAEITGADIGPRISQNDLWTRGGFRGKDYKEQALNFVEDNFSPQFSQGMQLTDALDEFSKGNISRGMAKVLPAAVRGFVTAHRFATEGEKVERSGLPVMKPEEFTTSDLINQSLGATPLKLGERKAQNRAEYGWKTNMGKEREAILQATRQMLLGPHTPQDIDAARKKIVAYNAKVPMNDPHYIINDKDLAQSERGFMQKQLQNVEGVTLSPAERRYLRQ